MRRVAALVAAAAVLVLAGCTPTVALTPAPQATSAACAGVVVRISGQTLGTLAPRQVNAQGTAAWGEPLAVTLYCGTALHPSDDPCSTYDGVDWKVRDSGALETFTTVGRTPIVEFIVNTKAGNAQDALPPISDAVKAATSKTGLGCTTPTAPSPSASP